MGGDRTDDMGIVGDIRRAGIARPDVGGRIVMPGAPLAAMKPCSAGAEKSVISARRMRPGAPFATSHFAPMAAPATTGDRIILGAQGDFRLVNLGETGQRRAARRDHGPAKLAPRSHRLVGAEAELVAELQGRNAVGMGGHDKVPQIRPSAATSNRA